MNQCKNCNSAINEHNKIELQSCLEGLATKLNSTRLNLGHSENLDSAQRELSARMELEHYDYAAILTEDEAWELVACDHDFLDKVDEYMKEHDADFSTAYDSVFEDWEKGDIDKVEGFYLRKDGLVELDLYSYDNPEDYKMVLRRYYVGAVTHRQAYVGNRDDERKNEPEVVA